MSLIRIIILLLIALKVQAQSCPKYDAALKKGDEAARTQNYHAALKAYQDAQIAARDCDIPSNKAAAGIESVFKEIEAQRDVATLGKKEALRSKDEAIRSKNEADSAKRQAELAKDEAESALRKQQVAFRERSEAVRLQKLAEAKTEAHKSIMFFNDRDIKSGTKYALTAYEDNIKNDGPLQNNDIYTALLLSAEQTNNGKSNQTSSASIKSVTGMQGSNTIYSANSKGEIEIWQYDKITIKKSATEKTNTDLRSIAISPSGHYILAVGRTTFFLYSLTSPTSLKLISKQDIPSAGKQGMFAGDKFFIVRRVDDISLYKIDEDGIKNKLIESDPVHSDHYNAVAVGKDGRVFIALERSILEFTDWNAPSKGYDRYYVTPNTITSIDVDPTGKYLAAGMDNGGIWLKTLNTDKMPSLAIAHRSQVNDIKLNTINTGQVQLATASGDNTVKLFLVDDGKINTEDVITLDYHRGWVNTLFYTPDVKYLLSGGEDRGINIWPTSMKAVYDNLTAKTE